jgi:hypothetical protein
VEDQNAGKSLARLADSICNQIYFASGAYNDNHSAAEEFSRDSKSRGMFFEQSKDVLILLSQFGYASLTHHLLETLEFFTPYDPKFVFKLIAKVVEKGMAGGYQYEQLAADLVVKLIERYIAEFRFIFKGDAECREALIKVLDIFVVAGWANARELTYHMEKIFR